MRRNSDERLRRLERAFESDPRDASAAQRYGLELLRRGSGFGQATGEASAPPCIGNQYVPLRSSRPKRPRSS